MVIMIGNMVYYNYHISTFILAICQDLFSYETFYAP